MIIVMENVIFWPIFILFDRQVVFYGGTVDEHCNYFANHYMLKNAEGKLSVYTGIPSGQRVSMTPAQNGGVEQELYESFAYFIKIHPRFSYIFMGIEDSGYVQWPEEETSNYDPTVRQWYKEAMAEPGKIVHTKPYMIQDQNIMTRSTLKTISNNKGEVIGVVGIDVNIMALTQLVKEVRIGDTGYVMLVDGDGTIIVDPREPNNNFKDISTLQVDKLTKFTEQSDIFEIERDGQVELVSVYRSPDTGWFFLSFSKKNELMNRIDKVKNGILLVALLFAIVGVIISIIIARRLTNKINDTLHYLSEIEKGNYYDKLDKRIVKRNDEIGILCAVAVEDITKRIKAEEILYNEKESLNIILQSIVDGVIATDIKGQIIMINSVAQEITGWKQSEAEGRHIDELFHIVNTITEEICESPIKQVLASGIPLTTQRNIKLVAKDGRMYTIANSVAPVKDTKGTIQGVVIVFRDVTLERQHEQEILYLIYHDKMTGLYNRRFLEEELKNIDNHVNWPLSVVIGDVNGLKMTNDAFGHEAGDQRIKKIAEIMQKNFRAQDIIARWGGDEFIILLPQTTEDEAAEICKKISTICESVNQNNLSVSISLGYATKQDVTQQIHDVLKRAEDFMYQAKLLETRSQHSSFIHSMRETLNEKSHETQEHAERLKDMAIAIGNKIGLPQSKLDQLALLALLHDIGKVAIRDDILNKPGKLTAQEWEEMQRHSEIGYRITGASPQLASVAEYILGHHERYDGQGYPRKLKGEEIPLLSRIIAVVDTYDAMVSDRPYRAGLPVEVAIQEIVKNAGSQFDPMIVEIFLELMQLQEKNHMKWKFVESR